MILSIGSTGYLGLEICRLLSNQGKDVRALVRSSSAQEKKDLLKSWGVSLFEGDIREPEGIKDAFQGVDTVISTTSAMPFSYIPGENDLERVDKKGVMDVINLAQNAGVKHFIYTSTSKNIDADFPLATTKRTVEQYLMESGMDYTILRPGYFMETWLSPAVGFDVENKKIQLYGDGNQPVSYISYLDVAKFALEAVQNPAAKKQILELGGPQMIPPLEVVHLFENLLQQKFDISPAPQEALLANMSGATDPMEKSFAGLMYCLSKGDAIPMDATLASFPVSLTSVEDFAKKMLGLVNS